MRHVVVMTATGAVGLMSLFLVDAANLFYISMLGETALAAAIGFAGTLQFFLISVSIGLSIAATAVVSRRIGEKDRDGAREIAGSAMVTLLVCLAAVGIGMWVFREDALRLLGAEGAALVESSRFLAIVLPSLPILGVGMVASGFIRSVGDARRAMFVTLSGGIVAAILDPVFIFGFGLGIDGAAIVSVIARIAIAAVGLWAAIGVHDIVGPLRVRSAVRDAPVLLAIAAPAVATQLSTPFGNAYLTGIVASHGDAAVAGWAVVGRLTALCFGGIFALSGAIGPIFGQNLGARLPERIRSTYRDALIFSAIYVATLWVVLNLSLPYIVSGFGLTGAGVTVVESFARFGAAAFALTGALFVSNAAFNNLGKPIRSTMLNWSRDAAVIPMLAFVLAGTWGAGDAILVQGLASILVGSAAIVFAGRFIATVRPGADDGAALTVPEPVPFASGRATLAARAPDPLASDDKSR